MNHRHERMEPNPLSKENAVRGLPSGTSTHRRAIARAGSAICRKTSIGNSLYKGAQSVMFISSAAA